MKTAIIYDPCPVARLPIRLILTSIAFTQIHEYGDISAALGAVTRLKPEMVVLESSPGGHDGILLIQQLLRASPRSRVVAFPSMVSQVHFARCLRAGVYGVVGKAETMLEVTNALTAVAQGYTYMSTACRVHESDDQGV